MYVRASQYLSAAGTSTHRPTSFGAPPRLYVPSEPAGWVGVSRREGKKASFFQSPLPSSWCCIGRGPATSSFDAAADKAARIAGQSTVDDDAPTGNLAAWLRSYAPSCKREKKRNPTERLAELGNRAPAARVPERARVRLARWREEASSRCAHTKVPTPREEQKTQQHANRCVLHRTLRRHPRTRRASSRKEGPVTPGFTQTAVCDSAVSQRPQGQIPQRPGGWEGRAEDARGGARCAPPLERWAPMPASPAGG